MVVGVSEVDVNVGFVVLNVESVCVTQPEPWRVGIDD